MRKARRIIEVATLIGTTGLFGQTAATIHQTATRSSCSNIVALSGAKINCSNLTEAQKKALEDIPRILKLALEDKAYYDTIMTKLEEIKNAQSQPGVVISGGVKQGGDAECQANAISGVATIGDNCGKPNPNVWTTAYACNGWAIHQGAGNGAAMNSVSDPTLTKDYLAMMDLGRNNNWQSLNVSCTKSIADHPDWLTPYLFCADASAHLGKVVEARRYFTRFESAKGDSYKDDPCPGMERFVGDKLSKLP